MASLLADVISGHGFTVRTAEDVARARREIDAFDPDMLLLDVSLGEGPTGIHLAHAMRLSRPDIAILVFTRHADIASATTDGLALPSGVGFLRKHLVSDQAYLIDAMEKVLREQNDLVAEDKKTEDVFAFLGSNGSRALRLLAEGYDNEEIASAPAQMISSAQRMPCTSGRRKRCSRQRKNRMAGTTPARWE